MVFAKLKRRTGQLYMRLRPAKVVKRSRRVAEIARRLKARPALSDGTSVAITKIASLMAQRTDPYPLPQFGPTVAEHFRRASSGAQKLAFLEQLVRSERPEAILEIGTAYGLSTIAMANAQVKPTLVTIERFDPPASIGAANVRREIPSGVEFHQGNKDDILPALAAEGRKFDFVFHDGGHTGDGYVNDFNTIVPMLTPGSVFIIDDIAWDDNNAVNRAYTSGHSARTCFEGWQEVLLDPRVDGAVVYSGSVGIIVTK